MFCINCGRTMNETAGFCPHCGARKDGTQASPGAPGTPVQPVARPATPVQPGTPGTPVAPVQPAQPPSRVAPRPQPYMPPSGAVAAPPPRPSPPPPGPPMASSAMPPRPPMSPVSPPAPMPPMPPPVMPMPPMSPSGALATRHDFSHIPCAIGSGLATIYSLINLLSFAFHWTGRWLLTFTSVSPLLYVFLIFGLYLFAARRRGFVRVIMTITAAAMSLQSSSYSIIRLFSYDPKMQYILDYSLTVLYLSCLFVGGIALFARTRGGMRAFFLVGGIVCAVSAGIFFTYILSIVSGFALDIRGELLSIYYITSTLGYLCYTLAFPFAHAKNTR